LAICRASFVCLLRRSGQQCGGAVNSGFDPTRTGGAKFAVMQQHGDMVG
jgi:hypothetical protein